MSHVEPLRTTHYALRTSRGFTLVEMIVSVALFAIVMLVSVSTLLALSNANRKAQALQSVMNNLNIALDSMVRSARVGSDYDGSGTTCPGGNAGGGLQDCPGGGTEISFIPYGKLSTDPRWVYLFKKDSDGIGRIYRSKDGGVKLAAITTAGVTIEDMKFYVVGTRRPAPGNPDFVQPKILVVIKGSAGASGPGANTTFHIEATIVQRVLDL